MKVSKFAHRFRDAPISRKLYFTVGIMALLIVIELAALLFSINTLSSVRAYVGGEGLWSKAQKDAMYQLLQYGRTFDQRDYVKFNKYMQVPLGDHKTLIELQKKNPDLSKAEAGFIEGRNHPEDVNGMIHLFSRFGNITYIQRAIEIWKVADSLVTGFIPIAESLHAEINSGNPSKDNINAILAQIDPINIQVTALEDDFSYTLGEGSRWLEKRVLQLLLAIALTVECTGLLLVILVNHGIQKGLRELLLSADAVAKGDLKRQARIFSKDEIGLLAGKFNLMSAALDKSMHEIDLEKKKFMVLLESAPDAMVITDQNGIIQLLNRQCENIFGYTRNELIGSKTEILLPEHMRKNYPENRSLFFSNPADRVLMSRMELQGQRKNGEVFPIEISLSSLDTHEGFFTCAAIRDISDRNYVKELERKNTDLEQYAYVASHDLREPLNTISATILLMQEEYRYKLDIEAHNYLNFIKASASRMSNLIHDLLEYSKLGQEIRYEEVNCTELIEEVVADMQARINKENAKVLYEKLPLVSGNRVELRLLFQNLLGNAMKFHKKGETPVVKIAASENTAYYHFTVQDNGIGMDKAHLTEIFSIFKRLNGRDHYEGTGIGLAHCKKIIELHNGQIWVDSEPGAGSTFHFTLPRQQQTFN